MEFPRRNDACAASQLAMSGRLRLDSIDAPWIWRHNSSNASRMVKTSKSTVASTLVFPSSTLRVTECNPKSNWLVTHGLLESGTGLSSTNHRNSNGSLSTSKDIEPFKTTVAFEPFDDTAI